MTNKGSVVEFEQGYNVIVTGRHVHVTSAMKDHVIERLSRLERLGNRIIDINVIMDIQKLDHRVEILMKYGHTVIRSHAVANDMYIAIDSAVEKLEKQLKRYKSKLQDHHAKQHPVVEMPVNVWSVQEDESIPGVHQLEVKPFSHSVVAKETRPLKILTEDEAIMKMELSQDPFMVFRSEDDRRIKVIYRRTDGHYGVIQPE